MNEFDYGDKKADGQYEKYPTITDGEHKNPLRFSYQHTKCEAITGISTAIAETYAKQPKFYTHTFCMRCGDHLPVDEFLWVENGIVTSFIVGDVLIQQEA